MEYNVKDITIERIASFETKRDGSPLVTKKGDPFKKVLIDIDANSIDDDEFTGKLSMLDFDGVADNWSEGDKITGKIIHNGDFWNFELPKVNLKDKVAELEKENSNPKKEIEILKGKNTDVELDDLPF